MKLLMKSKCEKRKFLILLMGVFMLFLWSCSKGNGEVVDKSAVTLHPDVTPDATGMDQDAKKWIKTASVGWNLGNSLEAYSENADEERQETSWGNPKTTKEMIDKVKAAGFNCIRIPVRWYPHSNVTADDVVVHSSWLNRVKEVVDYCIANDMRVIINTHHEMWLESHPLYADADVVLKKEKSLWRQIAKAFAGYDDHLAFAGTNEVHIKDNWGEPTAENVEVQNRFNQCFVDAVRSTGGKNYYRNLIVQTYVTSPETGLKTFVVPTDVVDGRMMVEFHYYQPYDYAGGATVFYWGTPYKSYGISSWGQEDYAKSLFQQLKTAWGDKGYPVVMGEFGVTCHYKEDGKERQAECRQYYMKEIVSMARSCGILPIVWDNNAFGNGMEKYGIFDRANDMDVRQPELLNGIMEGAKTAYPW